MRVLLDTHAFLWSVTDDRRLSSAVREIVADPENDVLFSAASALEISLKAARGRLELPEQTDTYVTTRIAAFGFVPLAISVSHAIRAGALPPIHADPWDRLLTAQAQMEGVAILTRDALIRRYDVETIW
ncbi:MAG TPA: type II toxin-antitoxin system VapC family toxin [Candidatus Limnocylindrales bacterium]